MARMFYVRESQIHGRGVFAGVDLLPGIVIPVPSLRIKEPDDFSLDTEVGNLRPYNPFCFLNHSSQANASLYLYEDDKLYLGILKVILTGEEIVINYEEK